jgi:hypothetical protein
MVTVIGDSAFVLNKNFEFNARPRDNAYFWRWLLSPMDGRGPWKPSPDLFPAEQSPDATPPTPPGEPSDLRPPADEPIEEPSPELPDELQIPDSLIDPSEQ